MVLETCDIENVIIDMCAFFAQNPTYQLPPRYLWVMAKLLQEQLDKVTTNMVQEQLDKIIMNPAQNTKPVS